MIIGDGFGRKNQQVLEELARLSDDENGQKVSVKAINEELQLDRTELKNRLEYLENLGYIKIQTIGGPWLYGHVSITPKGTEKASQGNT